MAKKAFVPHQIAKDIDGLKKKTDETVIIVDGKLNPFHINDLFEKVDKVVTSADMDADYVAPMGNSLVNLLTGISIGLKRPKQVKLLIYDNTGGQNYKEVVLKLKG